MSNVPRRYGKEKILEDISTQGGKPTPQQELALELNELKNTLLKMNKRAINDLFDGRRYFSDEECVRVKEIIRGVVLSLEPYSKKKKNG